MHLEERNRSNGRSEGTGALGKFPRDGKISWILLGIFGLLAAGPLAAADVAGTAFRDFDGDGVVDAGEPGLAGLTVDVYGDTGLLGSTTTAADGTYSVVGGLPGEQVRVEFIIPTSLDFLRSGVVGANSATNVVFLTMPADGSDGSRDVALANPAQHCQTNPDAVANCFIRGDQSGTSDVLVSFPYNASINTPAPGDEAFENQIGTTWGMAYQRSSDSLFLSAFQKRHSGYGDGTADGTGAIFRVVDPTDGTTAGISTFMNLNTLFGSQVAGNNPHPNATADFTVDAASYDLAGKVSFGDMDISEDELTLWLVNLNDRRLYEIPIGTDPTAPTAPTSSTEVDRHDLFDLFDCDGDGASDTASDVDLRPFAVKVHNGLVYVGAVCSAESTADRNDMRTLVYSFDPDTDTFTEVLNFADMTYDRGCGLIAFGACRGDADWQFWVPTWEPAGLLRISTIGGSAEVSYPQPMLADIEFTADDTMILGFRDRFGDQTGFDERDPDDTEFIRGDGFGDILRATPNGLGQWVISLAEASDGTEFFDEDDWTDPSFTHQETSFAGLALRMGNQEVLYTRMDPIDGAAVGDNDFSAGLHWASTATGAENQAYELYDPDDPGSGAVIFGKGNGLGDVELICELPPLEVGNRV
ncbi:MAG: SdrD B-like domain-containing protein, partial [Acidobacteriota bacterium]